MQIIAELDPQHLGKLQALEKSLKKSTSDEVFEKNAANTEGQKAYQLMLQTGFIGSLKGDENLSENYKVYLDWSHPV